MNEKNLSAPLINETRTGEDYNDLTLLSEVEIKYKLQGVRCRKAQCRESRAYYFRSQNHLAIDDKDKCS